VPEEYSGPLAQPIAETVARFNAAPGVSGIFLVVFLEGGKISVVNSTHLPRGQSAKLLRQAADQLDPTRILVA
jgi:hypothetical protein